MSDAGTQLYGRQCSLIVADAAGNGIDLSQLRIRFEVQGMTNGTPQTFTARVYNLAEATSNQISGEFTQVVLQAGYQGNFGTLFKGTIQQTRSGRENATDGFLDIFAADSDFAHNWSVINTSIAAGYTSKDVFGAVKRVYNGYGVQFDKEAPDFTQQPAPRGKVLYGMARDVLNQLAQHEDMTWHVEQGRFHMLAYSAYKPGAAVVLRPDTGLIGVPQQTIDGIQATCLLNPAIGPGTRVQIDRALISAYTREGISVSLNPRTPTFAAPLSTSGFYKVLLVNHIGDTRGNEWYSNFTCVALDPSAGAPAGSGEGRTLSKAIQAGP